MTKKRIAQEAENNTAYALFKAGFSELLTENHYNLVHAKSVRLRTCSAEVFETENFYLLKSYNTFVAVISKATNICADVLRTEYDYTATSAQHIAKFISDYGDRYARRYTARNLLDV